MSDRSGLRLLWLLAAVALASGLAFSVRSLARASDTADRFRRRLQDVEGLRDKEAELNAYLAAQQAFERLPAKRAIPLPDLLKKVMPDRKPDSVKEGRQEEVDGWIVTRKELTFNEAPVADVMSAVVQAENQRPPWRLTRFAVRASPKAPGSGQVVIELETISRE